MHFGPMTVLQMMKMGTVVPTQTASIAIKAKSWKFSEAVFLRMLGQARILTCSPMDRLDVARHTPWSVTSTRAI